MICCGVRMLLVAVCVHLSEMNTGILCFKEWTLLSHIIHRPRKKTLPNCCCTFSVQKKFKEHFSRIIQNKMKRAPFPKIDGLLHNAQCSFLFFFFFCWNPQACPKVAGTAEPAQHVYHGWLPLGIELKFTLLKCPWQACVTYFSWGNNCKKYTILSS